MALQRSYTWPLLSVIVALLISLLALPQSWRQWLPQFLVSPRIHLGLDLAGGTQLDFRISEDEIDKQISALEEEIARLESAEASPDRLGLLRMQLFAAQEQKRNLIEAIRTVLERRINALGVSEATITPSYIGNERHLLVECPGVIDTAQCIKTVGKTIQLEFKEEFTEQTDEFRKGIEARVAAVQERLRRGETLTVIGEDLGDELGIAYRDRIGFFRDTLPKGLEPLWKASPDSPIRPLEGSVKTMRTKEDGTLEEQDVPGIFLTEVVYPRTQTGRTINEAPLAFNTLQKEDGNVRHSDHANALLDGKLPSEIESTLRAMTPGNLRVVSSPDGSARILFLRSFTPGREVMDASHILVSYKGASAADTSVIRTKEEARTKATKLRSELLNGANFAALARKESDGPSAKEGGSLGTFGRGEMVPAFEEAVFALTEGSVSPLVETQFGYHIIRMDRAPRSIADSANFNELAVSGPDALTRANIILSRMQRGDIKTMDDFLVIRSLFFSLLPTGWKDTKLDGKHFRAASVTTDSITNIPVVQIMFDDEGGRIFHELTKRNVGKRIAIFVGGELVSAPTVQSEIPSGTAIITGSRSFEEARTLAQDLNTGAIPAPIHLSGQRTVEATLGSQALAQTVKAAFIGLILLMLYIAITYRLPGITANIALLSYAIFFIALLKLPLFFFSKNYIVMTTAGMAGTILSIGMAVDGNILIFERMKEELRKGKLLKTAIEVGFDRAWPSIRDANLSTLLTSAILFFIGTSIVRGFAITLSLGIITSMFILIIVSRLLLRKIAQTKLAEYPRLFM